MRRRLLKSLPVMLVPALSFAGCGGNNSHGSSGPSPTPAPTISPSPTPAPGRAFGFTVLIADAPLPRNTVAHIDAHLVNPWGLAAGPTGPFWVANNQSSSSTVYDGDGNTVQPLVHSGSAPTGVAFNDSTDFVLRNGSPAKFLNVTEGGTIHGWNTGAGAETVVDRSRQEAVYKDLAIARSGNRSFLYATDFLHNQIDRFDSGFNFVASFTDPNIPAGFAPFGIKNIRGNLFVTFAKQKAPDNFDDEPGDGNGFVDVFRPDGTLLRRLISRGPLNSPWGIALAPSGFGPFGNMLLIGNFGNGRINAFDPTTGAFVGEMQENNDHPMIVPGLWSLAFGNDNGAGRSDTLYLTSGPEDEQHGLFGTISLH